MKRTARNSSIDWEQARLRLRRNQAALEAALAETPERLEAAYRSRAERLARTGMAASPAAPGVPALVVSAGKERYAVELHELSEVLPYAGCTSVPGAPPLYRGVLNVRGELRTVVDLGRMLGSTDSSAGDSGFVLMLRRPGREIALYVDRIHELREFRPDELDTSAPPNFAKAFHAGALTLVLAVDAVIDQVFSKQESLST